MVFEDVTTAAIIHGYDLEIDEMTAGEAEALDAAILGLSEELGQSVRMFVPGDSYTDHADDPDEALYGDLIVIGFPVALLMAGDGPMIVSASALAEAKEKLTAVPDAFWDRLDEHLPDPLNRTPSTSHLSFGPLPSSVLCVGRLHPSAQRDAVERDFFECVDMDQEWHEQGVDGIEVSRVENTEVAEVDFDASQAKLEEFAADRLDVDLYLTVRMD